MSCNYTHRLLQGYIDGELDVVHSLEVEAHVEDCVECQTAYKSAMALRAAMSDTSFNFNPSAAVLGKLERSISSESAPPTLVFRNTLRYAAAAVVVLLLPFMWLQFNPANQVEGSIVEAHIRSLQANHLEDVISTDQHTVKPWFNGKLDYSPPVEDLALKGFPLTGGRLDFVENRPVAALVYHRAKHIINVFVWPTDQGPSVITEEHSRNGYNVFHWQAKQMTWWATSDLNPNELKQFCEMLRS